MRALLAIALLWIACDDETAAVAASSTVAAATTGGGGAAGMAGTGGTLGECPAAADSCDACDSIDLVCSFGDSCCICSNLAAQVRWVCADPSSNAAGCPAAEPVEGQPCQAMGEQCGYCDPTGPKLWSCTTRGWVPGQAMCP